MSNVNMTEKLSRGRALQALKAAVFEGMVWRYEHVVAQAVAAGATEDEIDTVAHEAIQDLLALAEQPVTVRSLSRHCG